ncbi:cutinase family protein [Nocardia nova]|uniref:cutinase family protein n=1 Tax=Nocardia nova TaxID=37330 RepID=UPI0033DE8BA9
MFAGRWRTAGAFAALFIAIGVLLPAPHASAQGCADVEVIGVRGTVEPGYLGAVAGDPFFGALVGKSPVNLSSYSVNYPANLLDPFSVSKGTADLVSHMTNQAALCPSQRFVLVGYSQGAAVVHTALGTGIMQGIPGAVRMNADLGGRIAAVLLFGDPMRLIGWHVPDPYMDRTADYSAPGDPVSGSGLNYSAHWYYGGFISQAVTFAISRL